MDRGKVLMGVGALIAIAVCAFGIFSAVTALQQESAKNTIDQIATTSTSSGSSPSSPVSQNAFLPNEQNTSAQNSAPQENEASPNAPSPSTTKASTASGTAPVTTTIATTTALTTVQPLTIPVVSNAEITIDPTGASSMLAFLESFSNPSSTIVFNNKEFNPVLKDENGVVLFVPELVDKALTDNNFSEINASLLVQKDFTDAEIKHLESIKVTGDAIAIDKEVIGVEELNEQLIAKALAVSSGELSISDFSKFNGQFDVTVSAAHNDLVAQMGTMSLVSHESWFEEFLSELRPVASAQVPVGIPFGGPVTIAIPCDGGMFVVIGPPAPAQLFATDEFMATPLFFLYRALHIGAFWLGVYEPVPIPCIVGVAPVDDGEDVLMAGTSV